MGVRWKPRGRRCLGGHGLGSTKAALRSFDRTIAKKLTPRVIRVNTIQYVYGAGDAVMRGRHSTFDSCNRPIKAAQLCWWRTQPRRPRPSPSRRECDRARLVSGAAEPQVPQRRWWPDRTPLQTLRRPTRHHHEALRDLGKDRDLSEDINQPRDPIHGQQSTYQPRSRPLCNLDQLRRRERYRRAGGKFKR
jgi:hypothetical protein